MRCRRRPAAPPAHRRDKKPARASRASGSAPGGTLVAVTDRRPDNGPTDRGRRSVERATASVACVAARLAKKTDVHGIVGDGRTPCYLFRRIVDSDRWFTGRRDRNRCGTGTMRMTFAFSPQPMQLEVIMSIDRRAGSTSPPHQPARRWFLTATGIAAFSLMPDRSAIAHPCDQPSGSIRQPAAPGDEVFIERAFGMRQTAVDRGDQAYGAVVVRDRTIIGQSWSRVIIDRDPTGHAEMFVIRDAARRLGSRELSGTVLYSSSRPCPMCEAAAYCAGIGRMVHGRSAADAGPPMLCG